MFYLIKGEQVCRGKPVNIGFVGHAKQACEVAPVGDGNSQLGSDPSFRVDEKVGRGPIER